MSMDIPERPQNIFWHPPYDNIVVYSDVMYDAADIKRRYGFDPRENDLSRCKNYNAKWFNAQYMHHKTDAELAALYQPILREHGIEVSDEVAGKAAGIMKERAQLVTDLWDLTSFFFVAPTAYDEKQVKKYWKGDNPRILREVREVLAAIDDFTLEHTEQVVHGWISEQGYGVGQVMNTLRLALVGAGKGPGMYDVTSFIGKEECLKRIDHLLANVSPAE